MFNIIRWVLDVYVIIIFTYALSTWVDPVGHHKISQALRDLVLPVLKPIQKKVPIIGNTDMSPFILIIAIIILKHILAALIG